MNPYTNLEEKFFWSTAIAKRNMYDIADLWDPKFPLGPKMKVATFGSCFAQHIGKALQSRGFNWYISEPTPQGLSAENAKKFNYGIFSARTGNIYTVSLLQQWVRWAQSPETVPAEIWSKEGRFYDPFRPNIEPDGFESKEELNKSRAFALEAFKKAIENARVFVFTMGLTESWFNSEHGYEYPMCPGTVAGEFNSDKHKFVNHDYSSISNTLTETMKTMRKLNPGIRFLLTISPVPLTATMSGNHVLLATMESKSILRSVAGSLSRKFKFVDYFPSYEIINGTPYRGSFFEPNQRSVNHSGVNHVMNIFFQSLSTKFPVFEANRQSLVDSAEEKPRARPKNKRTSTQEDSAVVCEEALLNAFSK